MDLSERSKYSEKSCKFQFPWQRNQYSMTAVGNTVKMNLLLALVLASVPSFVISQESDVWCDNEIVDIKCFDEDHKEIGNDGTMRRHDKLLVGGKEIPDACEHKPQKCVVIFNPPESDFKDINWENKPLTFELPILEIPPHTIENTGKITVKVIPYVIVNKKPTQMAPFGKCEINVDYSKPEVKLQGGSEGYYPTNTEVTIKAQPRNPNFKDGSPKKLTFTWTCSVEVGQSDAFCSQENMKKFTGKTNLKIPASEAKKQNIFYVNLEVALEDVTGYSTTVKQTVYFSPQKPISLLEIECVKNCYPKAATTLTTLPVILKAVCSHCGLTSDGSLNWIIKDSNDEESVDYSKMQKRTMYDFYLLQGALKEDEKYLVRVRVMQANGDIVLSAKIELSTKKPPSVKNCTIDPASGVAFGNGFHIECEYVPIGLDFEVFAVTNGKTNLLAKTNDLETESFMLPAGASVTLKAIDKKTGYIQSIELSVQVKACMDLDSKLSDSEIKKAVDDKLDVARELLKEGYSQAALQGIAAIVSEYSSLSSDKLELLKALDQKVLSVIKKIKIETPGIAQQVVDILAQMTERYDVSDPEMSVQTTSICLQASKVLLNEAKYSARPELIRTQVTNKITSLASCSQAGLKENLEAVNPADVPIIIPITEYPVIPAFNPIEIYPDYTDDETSSENMAQFDDAVGHMGMICFSNAKMLAFTMIPEEDPLVTIKDALTIVAGRMYCPETPHRTVQTEQVSVRPSTECRSQNIPIVNILMCTTNKNPFWYIDDTPLITPVVYIKFTGSTPRRSALDMELLGDYPFQVKLAVDEDVNVPLSIHQAPLPEMSISELDESSFYAKISTHRIFVFKNRGFTVHFQDMSSNDVYDITITNFEKPSYAYFKTNHKTLTLNNSIVNISEHQPYDSFWYLSVLPNQEMVPISEKIYFFSISNIGCFVWNETLKRWENDCTTVAGNALSANITCSCKSGHIFTGQVTENKVNLVENFEIKFTLKLTFCWIVYITAMVTFFLFSVVLFFTSFERPDDILDRVFFVGDVPSFYRYSYIIIIKTGSKRHSGTTSNITIKLHGSETDSLEHVLNYPDPDLVMLQRDTEIWFVIATEKLLGDIKDIEIWFDSIGNNTKWYCFKIEVYDIQSNKSWMFEIEKWFDVTQRDQNKFVFTPTIKREIEHKEKRKRARVLTALSSFLGKMENEVNLWNIFEINPLLTRNERVSFIFSFILLTYLLALIMYYVPSFNITDTIDGYTFGFHHTLMWIPFLSSTIAFLVHFPLEYLIKRGKIASLKGKRVHRLVKITYTVMTPLCWIAVVLISMTSMTLLIICGFWTPLDTSLLWLVSVVLGICFNILVLQNISRFFYGHLIKLPARVHSFALATKRILQYVELQRAWIYKRFGPLSIRPYIKHLYFNLDNITIKERFKWEETKLKIKEILEDLVTITLYVTMLYIVLMLDRESQAVQNHNEIKNLVYAKKMSVQSVSGIERFISEGLLPSIQSLQWYGKFVQDNPGMTKDFANKYLGIIRLRQHRTKEIKCHHPKELEYLNMTCRPDFNVLKESGNFSRGWKPLPKVSNLITERMNGVWKYADSSVTGAPFYFGEYGLYPGGGYVAPLGRNLKNSLINMIYLKKHKWLDIRTRAVFVEFLTYNPNVNLFNSVTLVFEINSLGHVVRTLKIQTRKFLVIDRDRVVTKNMIAICFMLTIFALIIRIVYKIIRKKIMYFYDMWALFDIFIVLLSFASIYLYFARLGRIRAYIEIISEAKNNEFVNYFHLFAADNILTALTATLVFVATLRLWKLLRFLTIIKITEKTLKDSAVPLLVCFVYQMVYMIAFSSAAVLFFSSLSKDFRNFRTAFTTLLLLGLNLFNDFETEVFNRHPVGLAFYTLYMMFSLLFVIVYVAIVSLYYSDAKDFYADEPGFVQKYVGEKWVYYKTLITARGKKLRGGEDDASEDLILKPKSGERYENCFTIARSRLDGMALVTMCVLRNLEDNRTMTEKDFELMSKTIKALFQKESSEKEIIFGSGDSRHIWFVDDRKIRQIADICERLARECQGIPRLSRKKERPLIEERMARITALVDNVALINRILDNIQINV